MDRYTLSYEGRARFKRTKIRMDIEEMDKMEGFEVLDYLYERGAATVEEIGKHTGLSYNQVVHKLESLMPWGYIERLVEL
jgi:DNA-binding MarR family transcriptional regulator